MTDIGSDGWGTYYSTLGGKRYRHRSYPGKTFRVDVEHSWRGNIVVQVEDDSGRWIDFGRGPEPDFYGSFEEVT